MTEAVVSRCSMKLVFLKILQNSQETPVSDIFNIITGWRFATLLKRGSCPGVFQEVLQNFQEHQPWMLPKNGCFRKKSKTLST